MATPSNKGVFKFNSNKAIPMPGEELTQEIFVIAIC
jgi:hypothetical protein